MTMGKRSLLVILCIIIAAISSYGQTKTSTTNKMSGFVLYYRTLAQTLQYPAASLAKNTIGLSVSRITIDSLGKVENVVIINSLDRDIDLAVVEALEITSFSWLKSDTTRTGNTFYVQIAFYIDFGPRDFFFKSAFPENNLFINPVAIIASPQFETKVLLPRDDEYLKNDCLDEINTADNNKALKSVNELIRRYPYSKQLYELRILIARKLNNQALVEHDVRMISDFAEGLSLDQLLDRSLTIIKPKQ
jgi:hypothetical protein